MGVPVVTLLRPAPWRAHLLFDSRESGRARHGRAQRREYVEIATRLAEDAAFMADVRAAIRAGSRTRRSPTLRRTRGRSSAPTSRRSPSRRSGGRDEGRRARLPLAPRAVGELRRERPPGAAGGSCDRHRRRLADRPAGADRRRAGRGKGRRLARGRGIRRAAAGADLRRRGAGVRPRRLRPSGSGVPARLRRGDARLRRDRRRPAAAGAVGDELRDRFAGGAQGRRADLRPAVHLSRPGALDDGWWTRAIESRLLAIANHSWDHLHPALPRVAHSADARGDFTRVASEGDADAQILAATRYLRERTAGRAAPYFAYPFGHWNDFLADDYLPRRRADVDVRAAFTTEPRPVRADDSVYRLPRYVCGQHWKHPDELAAILAAAAS